MEEKKLNKEQLAAVRYTGGPLLIIAGAGTGKTTVITERIKHLIIAKKVRPEEILALTFTEKAAKEMEERIDIALPYGYLQMWTMTFHSFCDRVLRDSALNIGLDPKFKLMTQAESVQLIRSNLFNFDLNYFRPLGNPNKFIDGMLQHFSRLQDEDISPTDYINWVNSNFSTKEIEPSDEEKLEEDKYKELSEAYEKYNEIKTKEGLMDYGDLIANTLKLFRERPNVLKEYQGKFKYILVDEFQDTNYAQNELVKLLVGNKENITVVADDNQSIYKFRGAAISNILQFNKTFPKVKTISLIKNYRSTQSILDSSYRLIKFNDPDTLEAQLGISKKLISQVAKNGEKIQFIHADRVENEAEEVAKEIVKLTSNSKYQPKDIAILVRANSNAEPFVKALERNGVPQQFLGPGRLFKQSEIIDLVSYLKVLYNFEDSVSFYRLMAIDQFEIAGREIAQIGNSARKNHISLFEAAEEVGSEKVKKLTGLINRHLELVKSETAGQLLYRFLEESGLFAKLLSPDSPDAERRAKNISRLFDKLKTYEIDHTDVGVPAVVDWLDLLIELGESPLAADTDWSETNAVNILTVHSAKGLEFPIVFLVNLVSQRFPTIERREQIPIPEGLIKEMLPKGDFHLEEERRLFYVGMTRAKEKLYFTAADYYGEGKREKKLSPFISNAIGDQTSTATKSKNETVKQLDISLSGKQTKTPNTLDHQKLKVDYLSYSQIETFQICPMHYKLRCIYNVPTQPSASASFGTSIHATLKDFYDSVSSGNKPSEALFLKILEKNWIRQGYMNKKHEQEFFNKGIIYLSGFLKEGFDPKILPAAMEQKFTISLDNNLRIGGVIDRIDQHPNGDIEIIDYKTGATIPTQKDVDKNLQLSFYALAATRILELPFGKKPEQVKLSLYFLDTQDKISTIRTNEQLDQAVEEMLKTRDEMENSDFKCSGHMFCQMGCEYSPFCNSES